MLRSTDQFKSNCNTRQRQQILSDQCRKALQPLVVEIIAPSPLLNSRRRPISAVYSTGGSSRLFGQFIEDTFEFPAERLNRSMPIFLGLPQIVRPMSHS